MLRVGMNAQQIKSQRKYRRTERRREKKIKLETKTNVGKCRNRKLTDKLDELV
jgi:hypothetical protein